MERRECETRYELAAAILPSRLRRIAMELPETDKRRAEEFRLRAGHCLSVLLPEGERSLEAIVTTEELETLCDIAAEFSRYASIETLRQGFLPVRGGFRVGLCGSAVVKDGEVTNLKQISSAVIRISREQKGIAHKSNLFMITGAKNELHIVCNGKTYARERTTTCAAAQGDVRLELHKRIRRKQKTLKKRRLGLEQCSAIRKNKKKGHQTPWTGLCQE